MAEIAVTMHAGSVLCDALKLVRGASLFWTREVYDKVAKPVDQSDGYQSAGFKVYSKWQPASGKSDWRQPTET